jgi:hypothetical protein
MMYLIVEEVRVHIPGDERSRECPGHGYPASTETYKEVTVKQDKAGVLEWLKQRDRYPNYKPFKIYECTRELSVMKTVGFDVL